MSVFVFPSLLLLAIVNDPTLDDKTKARLLQSVDKKPNLSDKTVSGGRLKAAANALGVAATINGDLARAGGY